MASAPWGIKTRWDDSTLSTPSHPKRGYEQSITLSHPSSCKSLYSSPLNITGWLDFRQDRLHFQRSLNTAMTMNSPAQE